MTPRIGRPSQEEEGRLRNISGMRNASVDRELRIGTYSNSKNIKDTLYNYQDNDTTFGIISPKQITKTGNNINFMEVQKNAVQRKTIFCHQKVSRGG